MKAPLGYRDTYQYLLSEGYRKAYLRQYLRSSLSGAAGGPMLKGGTNVIAFRA
jgi:hypothetical protein